MSKMYGTMVDISTIEYQLLLQLNSCSKKKIELNQELAEAIKKFGTLLHCAAICDSPKIAQYLINNGSEINAVNKYGETPLMVAVQHKQISIVNFLLEAGADIHIVNPSGKCSLYMAFQAKDVNLEICKALIGNLKTNISKPIQLAKKLIAARCTLNHAVLLKDVAIAKALLQYGCNVHSKDHKGRKLIDIAIESNDFEMVKLFIDYGADVKNCTLYYAAYNRDFAMLRLLLEAGVDTNTDECYIEHTPLCALFHSGKIYDVEKFNACIAILLEYGATDIDNRSIAYIIDRAVQEEEWNGIDYLIGYIAFQDMTGSSIMAWINSCGRIIDDSKIARCNKVYEGCMQMLHVIVLGTTSLFDLLNESERKMRVRMRKKVVFTKINTFCFEHLKLLYPYYCESLMKRVIEALSAANLEDNAVSVICNIFKKNYNECYIPAKQIVSYLDVYELQQLCSL